VARKRLAKIDGGLREAAGPHAPTVEDRRRARFLLKSRDP